MPKLPLGLIGCGAAATSYYIPALKKMPLICEDLYLVDKDIGRAKHMADDLGTQHYTSDHKEIIDKVRGVIIAVPHFLHYPIAMDFLSSHVHVFCEKPAAVTAVELHNMINEAETSGVTLSVNNTRRLFPNLRHLKRILSMGEIGELQSIRILAGEKFGWDSMTGFYIDPALSSKGVLLDLGAHVLDLVCWWVGDKPYVVQYQDDSFGGPESVAYVKARAQNCQIQIKLNRLLDVESYYSIRGTQGTVECNPDDWNSLIMTTSTGEVKKLTLPSKERSYREFVGTLVQNFLAVIERGEAPLVSAKDVRQSIELIDECYNNRQRFHLPWLENLEVLLNEH